MRFLVKVFAVATVAVIMLMVVALVSLISGDMGFGRFALIELGLAGRQPGRPTVLHPSKRLGGRDANALMGRTAKVPRAPAVAPP
jgi:hypothetical protein